MRWRARSRTSIAPRSNAIRASNMASPSRSAGPTTSRQPNGTGRGCSTCGGATSAEPGANQTGRIGPCRRSSSCRAKAAASLNTAMRRSPQRRRAASWSRSARRASTAARSSPWPDSAPANPALEVAGAGIEFAGEIVELGADVAGWRVGDRVMGRSPASYAELVAVGVAGADAGSESLSWAQAASIPNVFVTVHDAIATNAALQAGETVLVTAASSGIGTWATLRLAQKMWAPRRSWPRRAIRPAGACAASTGAGRDPCDRRQPGRLAGGRASPRPRLRAST